MPGARHNRYDPTQERGAKCRAGLRGLRRSISKYYQGLGVEKRFVFASFRDVKYLLTKIRFENFMPSNAYYSSEYSAKLNDPRLGSLSELVCEFS